jgi:hypothetical protein
MRSIWATPAAPPDPTEIHPALNSFATNAAARWHVLPPIWGFRRCLPSLAAIYGVNCRPARGRCACRQSRLAPRSYPAFAVSQFDLYRKTETYELFRHPKGGRKDILRWTDQGEKPVAELENLSPGGESSESGAATAEIAARMERLRGSLRSGASARCWFPCNFPRLAALLCGGVAQLAL